jgi:TatD DNase family protein
VNFKAYDLDRDEVIKRAFANDTWVINVGTQIDTSRKAVEIAHQYDEGVYAIIGLHPIHTGASFHDEKELGVGGKEFTSRGASFDKDAYRELLKDPKANKKIVAIGECGLDYYRMDGGSIEKQKKAFVDQIELANEFNKPLMLHIRNNEKQELITGEEGKPNAYADAAALLKEHSKVKGDVHFFAGSIEEAQAFLDIGFTLSFTGVITFAREYEKIIKYVPLDMIMSETDAPYVTPVPYRGQRNEPSYVSEVVRKIAKIKGLTEEEVAQAIITNAKRVFGI